MHTEGIDIPAGVPPFQAIGEKPRTPEDAARQFEEILIQQMVREMTRGLFETSLAGDDAPQWMGAYGDMQSEMLAAELARQLAASGRLGISEMLLKQWQRQDADGTHDVGSDQTSVENAP